ncbi:MAG: hypothetical protein Q7J25_05890 [Vicinamibacterales bacterium]|nr:hypothetical protein [Vicinamibacterales bacterium]
MGANDIHGFGQEAQRELNLRESGGVDVSGSARDDALKRDRELTIFICRASRPQLPRRSVSQLRALKRVAPSQTAAQDHMGRWGTCIERQETMLVLRALFFESSQ